MTFRPVDSKREEFRKYLEKTGVMDALTKVLVSLYEEESKPDDALGYIRKHLCDDSVESAELGELKAKLEESSTREKQLESEIAQLKEKLGEGVPDKGDEPAHVGEEPKETEPADAPGESHPEQLEEKPADEAAAGEANGAEGAPPADEAAPDAAAENDQNNQLPAAE